MHVKCIGIMQVYITYIYIHKSIKYYSCITIIYLNNKNKKFSIRITFQSYNINYERQALSVLQAAAFFQCIEMVDKLQRLISRADRFLTKNEQM